MNTPAKPPNQRAVELVFRLWSRFYDHPVPQRLYYRRVHRHILGQWSPQHGERVLDVGCGTGLFLDDLSRRFHGLELTGVDLSGPMLEQARRRGTRARLVEASVYSLPFEDGAFDTALNTISCHFYLEQVRAFREIRRVLRPGGRFFCAAVTFGPRSLPTGTLAVYHPAPVLEAHLRDAGFTVVAHEHIRPATHLFSLRA